ncbi:hypothetical protein [Pseudomonas sp. Hp2]|jgi:N-acetyl-gamma-glutamylphosphate reductase|uniref:hypothetical protein n=1 Tax=Pseudomonas sp. Hp2 TaxID=701189 RepID=UPI0015AC6806|nr:hypothetical protein [Pseudomonas sp. Hp2]
MQRIGGALCVAMAVASLVAVTGCAPTRTAAAARPEVVVVKPLAVRDARGAYRFDMSQGGRQMTADEFDAWMKANGIRIAKGAPDTTGRAGGK